jgi:DNA-directed RNA polymerase specialized sigma24 family protein
MPPQVADDEGAVISAFRSFFSGVQAGQFPLLDDRDDLWKVLATLTTRKAIAQVRYHRRKRRRTDRASSPAELADILATDPTPDVAAVFLEECQRRIDALQDDKLRKIVLLRLQGWDTNQIAREFDVHRRTIQRKLALIQTEWIETSEP